MYRVLSSPERWLITLFSQLALISQLCLHYFGKLKYCFEKQKLPSLMFPFCVCIWNLFTSVVLRLLCIQCRAKLYSHHFILRLPLFNDNFVLVEKCQVKLCKAETSNLKSILANNTAKFCFICSMMCYLIDFVDTTSTVRNFLRRAKLISLLF